LKTKTAAIIAIRDIYANDEIYVDYGNEYWNSQKQTVEE
jgi:SET domain-containing protein